MTSASRYPVRLFADDAAVRRVAADLLDTSLPRAKWTHEAHLAACLCLLDEYPAFDVEQDLPGAIARYNVAVGGVNDDAHGYHATITHFYIHAVRAHLAEESGGSLVARVNRLLSGARGQRDYPLRFYSRDLLFSVAARRAFVPPDLRPLTQV
ncbi:hypothetical protein [Altererythrobacter lauratis]|uniref:Uncharacterized protein n=1 Tax=Alteraurantiacibacter lauratis TaxID=2054627 RepID=A0ABV7EG51_9SPHN